MKMYLAIIGPKSVISVFDSVGVDAYSADTSEEVLALLTQFQKDHKLQADRVYGICYVMDYLLDGINPEDYKKLSQSPYPAIIPLPSFTGPSGFSETKMRRIIEQAIGSDIFASES